MVDVERRALLGSASAAPRSDGKAAPCGNGTDELARIAAEAGLRRIRLVAWRDLDDPEAGGSELHAHRIATRWAEAGLEVTVRTSAVPGQAPVVRREGYAAIRRSGRYGVFPAVAWEGLGRSRLAGDGLVEIWNGMPFLSPLWFRGPRVVFLHHVHAEMWHMTLPKWLAYLGESIERVVAPPLYRRSRIVTLSNSSRQEIVEMLGIPAPRVSVAPPGVSERFCPGGARSEVPLVVAVGRLVPVKRYDMLIRALAEVRTRCPELRAVIIGEGYERARLEDLRHQLEAEQWLALPGHLPDEEVVTWYRKAWVVASASKREGWGMTLTEAAACGTPAVATRIAGHLDAVDDGVSGVLTDTPHEFAEALSSVLCDRDLRRRLSAGALAHARRFTWEATARQTLEALAAEARPSGRRLPRLALGA